jgi:hypothetical protein
VGPLLASAPASVAVAAASAAPAWTAVTLTPLSGAVDEVASIDPPASALDETTLGATSRAASGGEK